jgi:uncharacterized membrane protein YedE/YeeE
MERWFPAGLEAYVWGGLLIGIGIGLVYWCTGRIAGISSFFTAVQSWWSRQPFFHSPTALEERRWKGVLVLGLVAGAALYTAFFGEWYATTIPGWRLAIGGIMVGYGSRLGRGCTSGHGICGNASLSPPSLIATAVFMIVAVLVAHAMMQFGAAQ